MPSTHTYGVEFLERNDARTAPLFGLLVCDDGLYVRDERLMSTGDVAAASAARAAAACQSAIRDTDGPSLCA